MLFRTGNIAKIDGPLTFLLYGLEYFFFFIDLDIQLILEFKRSFGKNCPFFTQAILQKLTPVIFCYMS